MEELLRMIAESYRSGGRPADAQGRPGMPAGPPLPSLFDWIRLQALIYEEGRRIQDTLFDQLVAPALRSAARQAEAPASPARTTSPEDPAGREIVDILLRFQALLLRYPIAAQAAYAALIAEGRQFAKTPEGAEWAAALASSDLLRSGRRVWDAVSFNMLEDDGRTVIPSAYLEAMLRAVKSADLDALLQALHRAGKEGEHAAPR